MLQLPVSSIEATAPLHLLGVDSLMAVELQTKVFSDFDVDVPVGKFIEGPSALDFAEILAGHLEGRSAITTNERQEALDLVEGEL